MSLDSRPAGRRRNGREEDVIEPTEDHEVEEYDESFFSRLWHTEPALIRGFVTAALMLAIAYGAPITPEQKLETLGFVGALFALGQAWSTRESVYSPATVDAIDDEADEAVEAAYHDGYMDALAAEANVNRAPVG